jgi:hypothetical protein
LNVLLPNDFFSFLNEFFNIFLLQIVKINAYNCLNTLHVFLFIILDWIWIFKSVLIPCKFSVLSLKMITISNHNKKLVFKKIYVFLYNKL